MKTRLYLAGGAMLLIVLLAIMAIVFRTSYDPTVDLSHKVRVAVSAYPAAEIARMAGGEAVDVNMVIPFGSEPHDFEPTPQQVAQLFEADLVLAMGAGFDPWIERLEEELEAEGVMVMYAADSASIRSILDRRSRAIELEEGVDVHADEDEHGEDGDDGHSHEGVDPHYWLDVIAVHQAVGTLGEQLAVLDPARAGLYELNVADAQTQLLNLHRRYDETLRFAACQLDAVVSSHEVLGYPAQRYMFEALSLAGLSPEQELAAGSLARVITEANERGIAHVIVAPGEGSPAVDTFVEATGAERLVYHVLETVQEEDITEGRGYLYYMTQNLETLRIARQCL